MLISSDDIVNILYLLYYSPDMMPSVEDFLVLLVIPSLDYIVFPRHILETV